MGISMKSLGLGLCLGAIGAAFAFAAQDGKEHEFKLPAGWTMEDVQACEAAGMPGSQHAEMMKMVGTWKAKNQMWMAPGTEAMVSEGEWHVSSMMGRYLKTEVKGDMPGMGPFEGLAIMGFDNVSQQYVMSWFDNMGTGIMQGTGSMSADGKTMTSNYNYNCPLTKKATVMREVVKHIDANTMSMEMFAIDPKSGKEFKNMHMDLSRVK
jgi:hypothetical protein